MTTDILENALAFADSKEHTGHTSVILYQAICACKTLAREVRRLTADKTMLEREYALLAERANWLAEQSGEVSDG